jgi:AcrR family transcriptional regulator
MPAGRKPVHSREEYVTAAISLADELGLGAVTLRALGQAMGVSTTAVYRYFMSKEDLFAAMRDTLLATVPQAMDLTDANDPRGRIIAAASAFRATVRRHPCLIQIVFLPNQDGGASTAIPDLLAQDLTALGLSGPLLVRGYQQLESLVAGSTAFDFAGAPAHTRDRATRLSIAHPEFRSSLASASAVDANNEAAFEASLRMVLDGLLAERDSGRT